ncbi:hypothetical protein EBU99_04655 [bacterium]|nr:hypothetical protein [bacterium]
MRDFNKCASLWKIGVTALLAMSSNARAAFWWYEQSERLQLVSAALLDGPPIAEPVPTNSFIEGRLLTSILPKPNPKVGAKEEKVPAAPAHTVPTLVFGTPLRSSGRYTLVATAWAGILPLPVAAAKIMGINASLNQTIAGLSAENIFRLPKMLLTTSVGVQYGRAKLEGGITSANAKDSFDASMTAIYVSQGVRGRTIPLWANGMLLVRNGKSKFNISAEATEFVRNDTMSDAPIPLAAQVSLGMTVKKSIQLAFSQYVVPERLYMPRVSIAYQYAFAGEKSESDVNSASNSEGKPTSELKKNRKVRRKKGAEGDQQ